MLLILWTVFGLVSGLVVSLIGKRRQNAWLLDCLLGVLGGVVAGQLSILTRSAQVPNPGPGSLFMAIAGAVATVAIYRAFVRERHA